MGLTRILSQIADVEGLVVSEKTGEVAFHDGKIRPDDVASVSAVVVHELRAFGELLGVGKLVDIVVQGSSSTLIAAKDEKIAAVIVSNRTDGKELLDILSRTEWRPSRMLPSKGGVKPAGSPPAVPRPRAVPPPHARRMPVKPSAPGDVTVNMASTHSIPPTPEAHTLKNLRLSLYFGDVSGAKVLQVELARFNYPGPRDSKEARQFEYALSILATTISKLLSGNLNTKRELKALIDKHGNIDKSIYWAALIWQARLSFAFGRVEIAKKAALAAYQVAHDFDSDTRTANRCTIAGVYVMLNDPDKAIRLLKSGSSTTQRCQIQAVAGLAHLTESHALALKQLIQNSKEAALKAEELLPRSPYPKLMLARLAFQEKDFKRAAAVYSEVLAINPKQPDALADLNILSRVESGKLSFDDANAYFTLREMAPTEQSMEKLMALHQSAPLFDQLTSLIAWRLLGQNKAEEAGRICASGNTIARTHRFKPNVVIGYGPSSIIAAGYYSVSKRLETSGHDEPPSPSRTKDGENDPLRLSISPERLQEILENGSQDNLFSGELRMFSMPDLLEFLRNGRRTGALICSSENGVGAVELRDGYITSAIVPNTDNIGTLLLKKGMIKKEDIEDAIDSQHNDLAGTRFGAVLVEKGLVESETIKEIIVEQTFSAIKAMLTWEDGRFAFAPAFDEEFDRAFVEVRLDSQHVLMELYRQLDEQNR